jgi:selenocysteine lyase/cysteine desulfurase
MNRITAYLSKTNVQLGASYHTGTQSNTKYEEGYQAAAKYINAGRDEIGITATLKKKATPTDR